MVTKWEEFDNVRQQYKRDNPEVKCADCSWGPFCGDICYDNGGVFDNESRVDCYGKQDRIPVVTW